MDSGHSYHREFLKSPHHGWLGFLTLGTSFASGHLLPLIVGATAYTIGWIYLPDLKFFREWVDRRESTARLNAELEKVGTFTRRRDALLQSLNPVRLERYRLLSEVCENIEAASAENPGEVSGTDPRLRKLDELMWTYLRLLTIEESLVRFLETEQREQLPALVQQAEGEIAQLETEMEAIKARGDNKALESKQRFFGSRLERLEVLRKRMERSGQAKENVALVVAEQERLDQQIKLIRADAVAMKNAGALTARIDATVEHLDQTNKWLSEMDEFKDIVGDIPETEMRVGFSAPLAMPEPPARPTRASARPRVRQ